METNVEVLLCLKSSKKNGSVEEEVINVPKHMQVSEFIARIWAAFWEDFEEIGNKFLLVRKYYAKFDRYVLLKTDATQFLEDGAQFEVESLMSAEDRKEKTYHELVQKKAVEIKEEAGDVLPCAPVQSNLPIYDSAANSSAQPLQVVECAKETKQTERSKKRHVTPNPYFSPIMMMPWMIHQQQQVMLRQQQQVMMASAQYMLPFQAMPSSGASSEFMKWFNPVNYQEAKQNDILSIESQENECKDQIKRRPSRCSPSSPDKTSPYAVLQTRFFDSADSSMANDDSDMMAISPEMSQQDSPQAEQQETCQQFKEEPRDEEIQQIKEEPKNEESSQNGSNELVMQKIQQLLNQCRVEQLEERKMILVQGILKLIRLVGDVYTVIRASFDYKLRSSVGYDTDFARNFEALWAPAILNWCNDNSKDELLLRCALEIGFSGELSEMNPEEQSLLALQILGALCWDPSSMTGVYVTVDNEETLEQCKLKADWGCPRIISFAGSFLLVICEQTISVDGGLMDAVVFYIMVHAFFGLHFYNRDVKEVMSAVAMLMGLPLPIFHRLSENLLLLIEGAFSSINSQSQLKWTSDLLFNRTSEGVQSIFTI